MSPDLQPGCLCFLVGLTDHPTLMGRAVEIIGRVPTPVDETDAWYEVQAAWASAFFPGRAITAPRRCLHPIVPPTPRTAQEREAQVH